MSSRGLAIDRAAIVALAALTAALVVAVAALPALPVDETRYLTVAWEMRCTGNWSLPTLNFAPYAHKPPLLFWLINMSWSLFGLAVWPARLVGAVAMGTVLTLTHQLDKRLVPGSATSGPALSALILLSLPLFVALGLSIMFDMLLTATVSAAMLALWMAGRTGAATAWVGYGTAIGLGLLTKGPIVLVFTVPAALLARTWIDPRHRRGWLRRLGLSLALGIMLALAWALRAADLGGAGYAEMLFWKQSAGRIADSFAHARPFWFYVPVLLAFFTPLLLWRPAWLGLRRGVTSDPSARNFLLAWILPALGGLSLISGKQLHYLLPMLPGIALLVSLGLKSTEPRPSDRVAIILFIGALVAVLAACALGGASRLDSDGSLAEIAAHLGVAPMLLAAAVSIGVILVTGTSMRRALTGLAAANLIFLITFAVQGRETVAQLFDIAPVAAALRGLGNRPVAVAQKPHGELGFLARLRSPVIQVPEDELPCWLVHHPDGIAVVRKKADTAHAASKIANARLVYEKRYRMAETITVLSAAPSQDGVSSCESSPP